jgi:hypothetical protein
MSPDQTVEDVGLLDMPVMLSRTVYQWYSNDGVQGNGEFLSTEGCGRAKDRGQGSCMACPLSTNFSVMFMLETEI